MLRKTTLREIKTSLARYMAIMMIVFLGVGFFAGLRNCKASMVSTAGRYLEEHNFYDYQIVSSYGIDDESAEIARGWDGVSGAEASLQIDVLAESGGSGVRTLRAISMPGSINTLRVAEGRLPESDDECVVDNYSVSEDGFTIGDSLVIIDGNDKDTLKKFRIREFKIVGRVNTPIYLDYQRGSTDIGDGSLDTFFFIEREAFDTDYSTALYVTLEGDDGPFTDELAESLKASEGSMEDLAEAVTAARRESARIEAQEELDEKKQEYEDGLAEYNEEKADADKKLADAAKKIDDGKRGIASMRKKLKAAIKQAEAGISRADEAVPELKEQISSVKASEKEAEAAVSELEAKKAEAEAGLREAEASRTQLEQGHEAGLVDDETYYAGIAEADAVIGEIKAGLGEIRAGLKTAKKGLASAEAGLVKLKEGLESAKAGRAEAKAGLKKAKAGIKELDKQEKKLNKAEKEYKEEKARAEDEFAKARRELDDAREKLEKAQKKIDDMKTGDSYAFSREDNPGYSSFDSNSSIVSNIAKVFPVFFFLIAALVCMTTMTRMAEEKRTQIGIMKALGYSNAAVASGYLFYSGSAALIGAVAGFFAGCRVFPYVIWNAYTMMYDFGGTADYVPDPVLGAVSTAAALLCSIGATWAAVARDFRAAPSDLIRPKSPPAGKRILLERIRPLWSRISFLYKVSIRNVFRDKKRFLMMVIGVSGCTALLVAGMGIRTTVARVADHQFDEISLYDYVTVFSKNMTERRQQDFTEYMSRETGLDPSDVFFVHQGEVSVETGRGKTDITCTAADPDGFSRYISLHDGDQPLDFSGPGEAVVVRKVARDLGLSAGDHITVRDGYKKMELTVSGVCDNYVYDSIYVSCDTYEAGLGDRPELKSAMVRLSTGSGDSSHADEDRIRASATAAANYDYTAAVSVNADVRENVSKMMESLDLVVYAVVLSAALLAFIVLYNLTNINITERIREIATIKVLGFNQLEVTAYVFRENMFLTAVAALVGIPLGTWLLRFVVDNIVVKMIYFEARYTRLDILTAVVLTFVFAGIVNLAMQRRLRNVSMTESLKSVE